MEKVGSSNEFFAATSKGLVLVDFYSTQCGPCQRLVPILEQLSADTRVKIVKADIEELTEISAQLKVFAVPTLILYKDGEQVKRLTGLQSLNVLQEAVNEATG